MTQERALAILKTGANVFLTGEPGAGKTYVINAYVDYLRARDIEPEITASTGIAATHIGGMTIHAWSGIGVKKTLDKYELDKIASTEYLFRRVGRAKILIIDEVSMLHAETLAMIDAVCRAIKNTSQPFGGLQVILVGDFFQLPPIVKKDQTAPAEDALLSDYTTRFAYDSPAWARLKPAVCYLTEQHRQSDADLAAILTAIRRDVFSQDHRRQIAQRKINSEAAPANAPKLFSHNVDVDRVNNEILDSLPTEPRDFEMITKGRRALVESLQKGCLSPAVLQLKEGAAVIFTKNNSKEGFVNGTLGKVESFDDETGLPIVQTRDRRRITVEPMDWTVEENGQIRARLTQLPLRLAWAITVHKSQGMSLDEAAMDLHDVFEYGQGYVALSRVRRLSGLHLLGWNERAFQVHPEVLEEDNVFRARSEEAYLAFEKLGKDKIAEMHKNFIRAIARP